VLFLECLSHSLEFDLGVFGLMFPLSTQNNRYNKISQISEFRLLGVRTYRFGCCEAPDVQPSQADGDAGGTE